MESATLTTEACQPAAVMQHKRWQQIVAMHASLVCCHARSSQHVCLSRPGTANVQPSAATVVRPGVAALSDAVASLYAPGAGLRLWLSEPDLST